MSTAEEFVDDTPRHLTATKSLGVNSTFSEADLGDREYWCKRCKARVTQTRDETAEYGHDPACEHSIRTRDDHALEWRGSQEDGADDE